MENNCSPSAQKILKALQDDPALIDELLKAAEAPVTRDAGGPSETESFISQLVGSTDPDSVRAAEDALKNNKVLELYSGAEGAIDAKELIDYVGGLEGSENKDSTVRAFLDGKLDLKEILMIIMLLKMFKKKNTNASYSTGSNLLSTLFGLSQPQQSSGFGNLFGYSQPQQSTSLFSNLFGFSQPQQQTNLFGFGTQQPQQNSLLNSLFGFQQPQQQTNLFGFGTQQPQQNTLNSLLSNFVGGNIGNSSQSQQFYNLLNNASNTAVNSNGQVNVSSLFSLLGTLLGK